MIVIGGKDSANTKQLYDLCSKICRTVHVERADEINFEMPESVGITAGASTPDWVIKEVIERVH